MSDHASAKSDSRSSCARLALALLAATSLLGACTQETQNKLGRAVQNWTGTNGVLEVYAGERLAQRFLRIDKLTSSQGTSNTGLRPYRYGYGVLDVNQNGKVDADEKKVYFEFSDYSTSYVFFEQP